MPFGKTYKGGSRFRPTSRQNIVTSIKFFLKLEKKTKNSLKPHRAHAIIPHLCLKARKG